MGAAREDYTEGGGIVVHTGKVLLCSNTGGAVVWGRDMGVVGATGAEARGSSCGVPETGDKVKGEKDEERFMEEGGGKLSTSRIRDTTAPDLHGQEEGNIGGIGCPTAHIQCMCKGDGL